MKKLILIGCFLLGSIAIYSQEKPTIAKKENSQSQIKVVPKSNQNQEQNGKVLQQKKQVKKVQMRQQKANQTRDRRKAIQRRMNHK